MIMTIINTRDRVLVGVMMMMMKIIVVVILSESQRAPRSLCRKRKSLRI